MNRPSLEKFAPLVKPGGVVLINQSLISITSGRDDVDELAIPVNEIAVEVGNVRAANVVALAAFVTRSKMVDFACLRDCVREEFESKGKSQLVDLNLTALARGRQAATG